MHRGGGDPSRGQERRIAAPTFAPQVWRLVSGPSGWGWGGREREREGLWEFARHFRLFVSFLGLCQKLTPLHHSLSPYPRPPPPEKGNCVIQVMQRSRADSKLFQELKARPLCVGDSGSDRIRHVGTVLGRLQMFMC